MSKSSLVEVYVTMQAPRASALRHKGGFYRCTLAAFALCQLLAGVQRGIKDLSLRAVPHHTERYIPFLLLSRVSWLRLNRREDMQYEVIAIVTVQAVAKDLISEVLSPAGSMSSREQILRKCQCTCASPSWQSF